MFPLKPWKTSVSPCFSPFFTETHGFVPCENQGAQSLHGACVHQTVGDDLLGVGQVPLMHRKTAPRSRRSERCGERLGVTTLW